MCMMIVVHVDFVIDEPSIGRWNGQLGLMPTAEYSGNICIKYNSSLSVFYDCLDRNFYVYFGSPSCSGKSKKYSKLQDVNEDAAIPNINVLNSLSDDMDEGIQETAAKQKKIIISGINVTLFANEKCDIGSAGMEKDFLGNGVFATNTLGDDINSGQMPQNGVTFYHESYGTYFCCHKSVLNDKRVAQKFWQQGMGDMFAMMEYDVKGLNSDIFLLFVERMLLFCQEEYEWYGYRFRSNIIFDKQCLPTWATLADLNKSQLCSCLDLTSLENVNEYWNIDCKDICHGSLMFDLDHCNKHYLTSNHVCKQMLGLNDNNNYMIKYPMYLRENIDTSQLQFKNVKREDVCQDTAADSPNSQIVAAFVIDFLAPLILFVSLYAFKFLKCTKKAKS